MQYEILARPAAAVLKVTLDAGESLTCESGAMIAMGAGLNVETSSRTRGGGGGILKGLKRMFSGENFFLNHFTSSQPGQTLFLGPTMMGDIGHYQMNGPALVVQGSGWLASTSGVGIDTTWQGFTSALFSGESMFWVKCSGLGDVFVNSYGAIYEVEVQDEYIVDTGHIVAFEETLQFEIAKAGTSLIGSFLSGEGLVCRFRGRGKLFCQSHNPPSLGKLLGPKLKPR